jgi:DNA-binding transcriptional ArsR family regulator
MVGLTPDLRKLRFRKTASHNSRNYSLNADMYRLFFAINENKTVAQLAKEIDMELGSMGKWLKRLQQLGLIEPLDDRQIRLDSNYIKLVKLNLSYIQGKNSSDQVEQAIKEMGFPSAEIPAAQAAKLLQLVSRSISESTIETRFREFMVQLARYQARIQEARLEVKRKQPPPKHPRKMSQPPGPSATKGNIKLLLDAIIAKRSKGKHALAEKVKAKFLSQGIDPACYGTDTPDDPILLRKLSNLAVQYGIQINNKASAPVKPTPKAPAPTSHSRIRGIIDAIIDQRSNGDPSIASAIKAKLRFLGVNVDDYAPDTSDNPVILNKFKELAWDLGVSVTNRGNPLTSLPPSQGRIKVLIDGIIQKQSKGDPIRAQRLKNKFSSKGIDPDAFTHETPDDPVILEKMEKLAIISGLIGARPEMADIDSRQEQHVF